MSLSISSLNVRGLGAEAKQNCLKDMLQSMNSDIFLLQETKFSSSDGFNRWKKKWGAKYSMFHVPAGSTGCGGVAAIVKNTPRCQIVYAREVVSHRCLDIQVIVGTLRLNIINLYAPCTSLDRKSFFTAIRLYAANITTPLLLAGDFNCVEDPELDRMSMSGDRHSGAADVEELQGLIDQHDLIDVWRSAYPEDAGYTYYCRTGASRLDRFYLAGSATQQGTIIHKLPCPHSDHWALTLRMGGSSTKRDTTSPWKLNTELLHDALWCNDVKSYLKDAVQTQIINGYTWDLMKTHIAQMGQRRSRQLARRKREAESALQEQYLKLIAAREDGEDCWKDIQRVQAELSMLHEHRMKGAAIRARAQWLQNNEAPSKRFFRMEREHIQRKHIDKLRVGTTLLTNPRDIVDGVRAHYRQLYGTVHDNNPFKQGLAQHAKQLDQAIIDDLNIPITEKDIYNAMRSMRNNISPGIDGLPVEFYKRFCDQLKPILLKVFEESISRERLPPSQRVSLITLLPKTKDKEQLCDIHNWRPISLLNVDYKIFTKILANRMGIWLNSQVNVNQKCVVPGRSIHEATLLLDLLQDRCRSDGTPLALLQIDLKAAFDCVDHAYMFNVLSRMGIKGYFLSAIRACYTGAVGRIIVNGEVTDEFPIQRSVRQGCPLSMALFILQLDPILNWLDKEKSIKGANVGGGTEIKAIAYADDITLLLSSRKSIVNAMQVFHGYEMATGMQVNKNKCQGLWLGKWPDKPPDHLGMKWNYEGLKVLGIWIGAPRIAAKNWENTLRNIQNMLSYWKGRRLSYWGRITIWNTYVLPTLLYRATTCVVPCALSAKIDRQAAIFVWRKNYEPARRETLTHPREEGGLGLISMSKRVQAMNILLLHKLMTTSFTPLKHLMKTWIKTDDVLLVNAVGNIAHCPRLPPKIRAMVRSVHQHLEAIRDLNPKEWSTKLLHIALCKHRSRPPRLPCRYGENHARKCIERIKKLRVLPTIKDFLWKIISDTLPTGSWMEKRGMCAHISDLRCYHCHKREDVEHVLYDCNKVKVLWRQLSAHCNITQRPLEKLIKDLPSMPEHELLLLGCIGTATWRARNDVMFRAVDPSSSGLDHLFSLLKYQRDADKERLPDSAFRSKWETTGLQQWLSQCHLVYT